MEPQYLTDDCQFLTASHRQLRSFETLKCSQNTFPSQRSSIRCRRTMALELSARTRHIRRSDLTLQQFYRSIRHIFCLRLRRQVTVILSMLFINRLPTYLLTDILSPTILQLFHSRERVFIRHNASLPERDNVHQCWRPNNKNTKLQVQKRSTKSSQYSYKHT